MFMNKIKLCGGFGEHGRNCFLIEYSDDEHFYMLDCGIMDTDNQPNPHISPEQIQKTDYLFISHCHKDHAGAFKWLVENGFTGQVITTEMTCSLAGIKYDNVKILPLQENTIQIAELSVKYGKSGHCPGSLWFQIKDREKTVFYTGDYQKSPYIYKSDVIEGKEADIAIIDEAHNHSNLNAEQLRQELWSYIESCLEHNKKVILPVPKYGRGVEMAAFLQGQKNVRLYVDSEFEACYKKMTVEPEWYQAAPKVWYAGVVDIAAAEQLAEKEPWNVFLIADTHLVKEENAAFVKEEVSKGAELIITGRIRNKSVCEELFQAGKAKRFLYPHHQSKKDAKELISSNHFSVVMPFHNDEQIIIAQKRK